MKDQPKNSKLKNYTEKKFCMHEYHRLQHWTVSPVVSNCCLGESYEPQYGGLTAVTPASPLVKAFILFAHFIECPPQTILQQLLALKKSEHRGNRSVRMRKSCLNHNKMYLDSVFILESGPFDQES